MRPWLLLCICVACAKPLARSAPVQAPFVAPEAAQKFAVRAAAAEAVRDHAQAAHNWTWVAQLDQRSADACVRAARAHLRAGALADAVEMHQRATERGASNWRLDAELAAEQHGPAAAAPILEAARLRGDPDAWAVSLEMSAHDPALTRRLLTQWAVPPHPAQIVAANSLGEPVLALDAYVATGDLGGAVVAAVAGCVPERVVDAVVDAQSWRWADPDVAVASMQVLAMTGHAATDGANAALASRGIVGTALPPHCAGDR